MKSPFAFHDWARDARRAAVWRLEGYVRKENVVSGLDHFIGLAEAKRDHEVRQMLARIRQGIGALGHGRRRTIPRWLAALTASLDEIGLREGLAADSAGAQLLDLVGRLGDELAADTLAVEFSEWRRWLARQLEGATFRDRAIESPVVFTSLAATRLRSFDAVLILGADAAHLPGPDPASMFFSQGVRAELKLPTWSERVAEMEEDLAALIASCGEVAITWQRMAGGEDNLLSPIFERLAALHELAYKGRLDDPALVTRLARTDVRPADAELPVEETRAPAPSAGPCCPAGSLRAPTTRSSRARTSTTRATCWAWASSTRSRRKSQKRDYGSLLHERADEVSPRASRYGRHGSRRGAARARRAERRGLRAHRRPQLLRPGLARAMEGPHSRLPPVATRARGIGLGVERRGGPAFHRDQDAQGRDRHPPRPPRPRGRQVE